METSAAARRGRANVGSVEGGAGVAMVPKRLPCHGGKRRHGRALTIAVATAAVNCAAVTTRTLRAMGEGGTVPHHNRGGSAVAGTSSYVETL